MTDYTTWTHVIVHADLDYLRKIPKNVLPVLQIKKTFVIDWGSGKESHFGKTFRVPAFWIDGVLDHPTYFDEVLDLSGDFEVGNPYSRLLRRMIDSRSDDDLNATDIDDSDVETETKEPELC